jgi:hypothetical protein
MFDFFETSRFYIQKKYLIAIITYYKLKEALTGCKAYKIIIYSGFLVLRKRIPDSFIWPAIKYFNNLLKGGIFFLKGFGAQKTKIKAVFHVDILIKLARKFWLVQIQLVNP